MNGGKGKKGDQRCRMLDRRRKEGETFGDGDGRRRRNIGYEIAERAGEDPILTKAQDGEIPNTPPSSLHINYISDLGTNLVEKPKASPI
jgi:hypothetical protein